MVSVDFVDGMKILHQPEEVSPHPSYVVTGDEFTDRHMKDLLNRCSYEEVGSVEVSSKRETAYKKS